MFDGMMEGVVLGMGRIDGNLRLLDVTDNMERSVGLANTKGYRPAVSGWTANAAYVEAISCGPSVVWKVGPNSAVPSR